MSVCETGQQALIEDGGGGGGSGRTEWLRRRDDDEETAISGRSDGPREEGRIHEHDSTAIAPDAATDAGAGGRDGRRQKRASCSLGESFNLSGGANSK